MSEKKNKPSVDCTKHQELRAVPTKTLTLKKENVELSRLYLSVESLGLCQQGIDI